MVNSLGDFFRGVYIPLARFGLFMVYFWFGFLKLIGMSPAGPLVQALFERTLSHFLAFGAFYTFFSLFEMLIGVLFLIRGLERWAIGLMILHIFVTILPLFVLTQTTWQTFFVPTLEGQYILKNILILACAAGVGTILADKRQ